MARKFYTPYDVNCTNLHILPARNFAHFDSNWPPSKLEEKFVRACPKPKLENDESEDHRLQYLKKKTSWRKFRFIDTLSNLAHQASEIPGGV